MSESKAVYVVTVGGGKCLDNTQSAHGVLDCIPTESESQKWFVETDENDANIVAFKSSVDGQYLRNNEPAKINWGKIGMGEKQWWTLEKGKNPGSCLIRSNACTAGASYLNDFEGVYRDRNYVHMWQMVKERQFWLDWYIVPADATFSEIKSASADASKGPTDDGSQQKTQELDEREAALAKREATLEEGDAALEKREQDLAKREAALEEQSANDSAAVAHRTTDDSAGLPNGQSADDSSQNASQLELLRAENENLKLKLKIQDLEEQLRKSRKPQDAGKPRTSTSSANGLGKKEPIVYDCGHVAYPPPRKLRRHIVGMLYEGLDEPFKLSDRQKATLAKHEHHH